MKRWIYVARVSGILKTCQSLKDLILEDVIILFLELIAGSLYFNVMASLIFYIHHYTVFEYVADVSLLKGPFILKAQ